MTNSTTTTDTDIAPICQACGFQSPGGSEQDHIDDGWMLDNGYSLCDECHLIAEFADERII